MRFWSTNFIIKEFDKLIKMGVRTIRIVDEMFLLNPKYYIPLCEQLAERNKDDSLRIWSYSRIDTVKRPEILKLVRRAGIKWLALGIESGERSVRLEVDRIWHLACPASPVHYQSNTIKTSKNKFN